MPSVLGFAQATSLLFVEYSHHARLLGAWSCVILDTYVYFEASTGLGWVRYLYISM